MDFLLGPDGTLKLCVSGMTSLVAACASINDILLSSDSATLMRRTGAETKAESEVGGTENVPNKL
jgi:hypothetical protein